MMRFCLGTVQFGMDYGVQGARRPCYPAVKEIMDYAWSHGIRAFDSAASYGEAQNILGHYLSENKEQLQDVHVVSKLPPNAFDGVAKEKWGSIVVKDARKSLEILGIRKLRAYLLHNAGMVYNEDAVRALYKAQASMSAWKTGVSVYSPQEALKALEYEEISVIQVPYNVFDHRLEQCGFFEKAKKKKVEVYARSTLLQGLLLMDEENLPERVRFAKDYLAGFKRICTKYGISPLQAAVGYVGRNKGVDYIVFGTDSLAQLKEYIAMRGQSIPDEMMLELEKEFEDVEERLVNPALWN